MKKVAIILLVAVVTGFGWWFFQQRSLVQAPWPQIYGNGMKLTSLVFVHNGLIPKEYTCDGVGEAPPLLWSEIPAGTKSLALIVDDPDAPRGIWTHWLMWNIDPKTVKIEEEIVPSGAVQGKTSSGENHWGPPCPPSGIHHYRFKLWALDSTLSLGPEAMQKDLETAAQGHVLEQTELVGLYARQK